MNPKQIAPPRSQTGKAEQWTARFLHEGGLAEELLKGDKFYFEIKNGDHYGALVVERQSKDL